MHWKKLLINTIITVGVAAPLVTMIAIGSNSRPSQASASYLMNFEKGSKESKYIENLKEQVKEVFAAYKKENPNFKGLQLEFITLKSTLTPGDINFFSELNKSLMAINPNLSFKLTQRNQLTLQQGFYDRNVDMTSFYWGPDYNGIGTWLTYVFSEYQVPNLWPGLASEINKNKTNNDNSNWVVALREHLKNFSFEGANGAVPIVNNQNEAITYEQIYMEGAKIKEQDPKSDWTINKANSTIGNAVGAWANELLSTSKGELNNSSTAMESGLYKSFEGGFKPGTFQASLPTQMLNFLTSFRTNLPYIQDGGNTINATLLRKGAHLPTNPNSNPNYRDYYYDPNLFKNNVFKQRITNDPFLSTISPFNPTFTKSSTTTFNTIYTPLFSWSTMGDYYASDKPDGGIQMKNDFKIALTSFGTSLTLEDFTTSFDSLFNPNGSLKDPNNSFVELPIRPIPWVNSRGQTTQNIKYLSPQDFLAGFIGYGQSVKTKFNKNNYFLNLTNIDIKKTIEDPENNKRNTKPTDKNSFRVHFKKKELGAKNIADILSMQYFNALPAFSEKVQNIIDPNKFKKYAVLDGNGILDQNKSKMIEFYGNGAGKDPKVWSELWSASPYYISEVNDTRYVFQKNEEFFKFFDKEIQNMNPKELPDNYNSYKSEYQVDKTTVRKIPTFQITYGDNYKEQITYEQFKVGEIDTSNIPPALKNEVYQTSSLKNNIYYAPVTKVNKSDLIPYNLQVFQTEIDGTPKFEGHDSNTQILKLLKSDRYGNIIYPKGYKPKTKTKLTPGYIDLIVNNFYTPIDGVDENGKLLPAINRSSAIIRSAINDCINWMSINSLISADITRSFQNSFFPFGVAKLNNDQTLDSRWDYWNLAAYKIGQENVELGKRLGGIIQWTLPELLQSWERQASKR